MSKAGAVKWAKLLPVVKPARIFALVFVLKRWSSLSGFQCEDVGRFNRFRARVSRLFIRAPVSICGLLADALIVVWYFVAAEKCR